jgi:hypothetical protein
MADRSRSLQQAASIIFVLTAILPLLIFTWTLHTLNVLATGVAQIGLTLALVLALSGYLVLRSAMTRLSEVARAVIAAAEAKAQIRRPGPEPQRGPVPPLQRVPDRKTTMTPGLGAITELSDMTAAIAAMWSREAEPHVGRPVLISVVRATDPVAGILKQLTTTGLVLDHEGQEMTITYQRISGIEPQG